jgi:hypothetical protein
MTEQEWLKSDHLEWLVENLFCLHIVSERKLRLYACACCRRVENLIAGSQYQDLLALSERYADDGRKNTRFATLMRGLRSQLGHVSTMDAVFNPVDAAREAVLRTTESAPSYSAEYYQSRGDVPYPLWAAAYARLAVVGEAYADLETGECLKQLAVLREITGNPFRPVKVDPSWLAWSEGTVVKLAQGIYEDRAFDRLPVLADALEEAGCDNAAMLAHCRQAGEHVRGCWVIDLVTGKE